MKRDVVVTGVGTCPDVGKRMFLSRADAKQAAKRLASLGRTGERPYFCAACDHWHVGRKPKPVMLGEVSASEWYGVEGPTAAELAEERRQRDEARRDHTEKWAAKLEDAGLGPVVIHQKRT